MIPLRDNVPSRTTPFVNYAIILICALTFYAQLRQGPHEKSLIEQYGMIPARVNNPGQEIRVPHQRLIQTPFGIQLKRVMRPAAESPLGASATLLTCIFLHGGWMHFLGNMWFLFIFGDNVEDRFGHIGYLLFYLAAGVAASATHLEVNAFSHIPTIGASGAVAGVMGAYMYLYPRANVVTLVPIFVFLQILVLPAPLFLGIWFVMQFFQGVATISTNESSGVAWWAHIGGFVVGLIVALVLGRAHILKPVVRTVRPQTDRITSYRVYPRR